MPVSDLSAEPKTAIVIGAGIGGLSAAVRLAVKGYQVSVFDKNDGPGGKLTQFQLGKYRFDFGPSLFTMPAFVEELFQLAGKTPGDYFSYESLDHACRYYFSDGMIFTAPTNVDQFCQAAAQTFQVNPEDLSAYFSKNQKIFEKAGWIFLNRSMYKLSTFLNKEALDAVLQTYVIELFRTMHRATLQQVKEPHLVQLFDRYATYNGSSPYRAPGILNSISILEHLHGTYFPRGGMFAITSALHRLALELGVRFAFNTPVEQILTKSGRVSGILAADGQVHPAEVVISNMDVTFTYQRLLKGKSMPWLQRGGEKSSSAVIFYWGVKKVIPALRLHNIFFSRDYQEEFEALFQRKALGADPTVYVNISSVHEPDDAPEGCSNWFVMVNAPADHGQDWDTLIKQLRQTAIDKLNAALDIDLHTLIEEEYIADPRVIEAKTLSHRGALYGHSSNHWLNAFLRHPNFSGQIKGLYFVGGSVHPGGGIPLCLLSSKIAASLIP